MRVVYLCTFRSSLRVLVDGVTHEHVVVPIACYAHRLDAFMAAAKQLLLLVHMQITRAIMLKCEAIKVFVCSSSTITSLCEMLPQRFMCVGLLLLITRYSVNYNRKTSYKQ